MTEQTKEEKKMTREEAIETVRRCCPRISDSECDFETAMRVLIPELAESEDERIRKAIIEHFKQSETEFPGLTFGGYYYADVRAWLEKQKELFSPQPQQEWSDEDERMRRGLINFLRSSFIKENITDETVAPWITYLERQKENIEKEYVFRPLAGTDITIAAEQAIRRANEGDRLVLAFNGAYISVRKGCTANKIVDIYDSFIEEQQDASKAIEAVERIDKYIDEHTENAHDMKDSRPDKKYCQGIDDTLTGIAWILQDVYSNEKQKENHKSADSIPSNCTSYAKCEDRDSEYGVFPEDAIVVARACEKLEAHGYLELAHALINVNLYTKEQNKSLRPHWKPSEEQMKALLNAEGFLRAGLQHDSAKTIAGLYEQLKKLM